MPTPHLIQLGLPSSSF
uniref:Uncharacterized protein n=1 Tax=Rhizophora mucronata TaxID=61149 RepID=A0A2P2PAT6_RHIMU